MDRERLLYLLRRCINGQGTREDEEELFDRLEFPETEETFTDFLDGVWNNLPLKFIYDVVPDEDLAWEKMWARIQGSTTKHL